MVILFLLLGPNIKITQWVGPGEPITYQKWRSLHPSGHFRIGPVVASRDTPVIDIVVNSSIYDSLLPDLQLLKTDIEADGYSVRIDTASFENTINGAIALRNHLISIDGLSGAILIGDLPVPWYQMINRFFDGRDDYEEFPIDLYYMDLDGVWLDTLKYVGGQFIPGSDSIFDTHEGECGPEIWVSRLTTSPLGDEVKLIRDYIDRAHRYREGTLILPDSALVYVDDDWIPWAFQWSAAVGLAYPNRTLIYHAESTRASDYRVRLKVGYEWTAVHAHSSFLLHGFKINNGSNWTYFYGYEIPGLNPDCSFYNLFACSNARYVEEGYMGGRYVFQGSYGLGAIGSTKTGSMLEFQDFYGPLGEGDCLGDAFRHWFEIWGEAWGDTSRSWFYGLTLLGDGSLAIKDTTIQVAERAESTLPHPILPSHIRSWQEIKLNQKFQLFDITGRRCFHPDRSGIYFIRSGGRVYRIIKL